MIFRQRPRVLTVEDKLMVLGCRFGHPFGLSFLWVNFFCLIMFKTSGLFVRDLERRIVEAEMELTLAKSQGYLKGQSLQSGSSSDKKLLAVIGVYTGFGSHLQRKKFRGSWFPRGLFDSQLNFSSLCKFLCILLYFLFLIIFIMLCFFLTSSMGSNII